VVIAQKVTYDAESGVSIRLSGKNTWANQVSNSFPDLIVFVTSSSSVRMLIATHTKFVALDSKYLRLNQTVKTVSGTATRHTMVAQPTARAARRWCGLHLQECA
ncbi:hypothetical protein GBAR_LOCUS22696, partial [Geodia barretti]